MKRKITCLLICLIWISGLNFSQSVNKDASQSKELRKPLLEQSEKDAIPTGLAPKPIVEPIPDPISKAIPDSFSNATLIVSVGDSLTEGIGDSTDHGGYLPYLEKKLENEPTVHSVKMENHGVKGNRSDQLLKQLDKEKISRDVKRADSIVVTIGGNDIMKVFKQHFTNLEMKQFTSAKSKYEVVLSRILDKIRTYNKSAPIYLVGLYNPLSKITADLYELDQIIADWNKSGEKVIAKYDSAYFIQIGDIFKNTKEELLYTEDYFHPNNRGYELIATRIYNNMDISTLGSTTIEASSKGDGRQQ